MRSGHLNKSTLQKIVKAVELDMIITAAGPRIMKHYIPSSADNPLYFSSIFQTPSHSAAAPVIQRPEIGGDTLDDGEPTRTSDEIRLPGIERSAEGSSEKSSEKASTEIPGEGGLIHAANTPSTSCDMDTLVPSNGNEESVAGNLLNSAVNSLPSASVSNSSMSAHAAFQVKGNANWHSSYDHIDADWSMRAMDILYSASFYDYVKDEENIDVVSRHLNAMAKDFKLPQVAGGLRWITTEWKIESIAKLLRNVFSDWLPDLAGSVFALMSNGWPVKSKINLCVAFMLIDEPASICAVFVRALASTWGKESATQLISYLDSVLEWDETFFYDFIIEYVHSLTGVNFEPSPEYGMSGLSYLKRETAPVSPNDVQTPDSMLKELASLYKTNLNAADYNLMLADARLAMAEYNLAFVSHFVICEACPNQRECSQVPSHPTESVMANAQAFSPRLESLLRSTNLSESSPSERDLNRRAYSEDDEDYDGRTSEAAEYEIGDEFGSSFARSQLSIQSEPAPLTTHRYSNGADNPRVAWEEGYFAPGFDMPTLRVGNSAPNLGQTVFGPAVSWLLDSASRNASAISFDMNLPPLLTQSVNSPVSQRSRQSSMRSFSRSKSTLEVGFDSHFEDEVLEEGGNATSSADDSETPVVVMNNENNDAAQHERPKSTSSEGLSGRSHVVPARGRDVMVPIENGMRPNISTTASHVRRGRNVRGGAVVADQSSLPIPRDEPAFPGSSDFLCPLVRNGDEPSVISEEMEATRRRGDVTRILPPVEGSRTRFPVVVQGDGMRGEGEAEEEGLPMNRRLPPLPPLL